MGHEHVTLQLTSLLISFCVKKKKYGFKFFSQQKGIYLSTLSIGNVHSVTRKHYVLAERKKKSANTSSTFLFYLHTPAAQERVTI